MTSGLGRKAWPNVYLLCEENIFYVKRHIARGVEANLHFLQVFGQKKICLDPCDWSKLYENHRLLLTAESELFAPDGSHEKYGIGGAIFVLLTIQASWSNLESSVFISYYF